MTAVQSAANAVWPQPNSRAYCESVKKTPPPGRLAPKHAQVEFDSLLLMTKRPGGGVFGRTLIRAGGLSIYHSEESCEILGAVSKSSQDSCRMTMSSWITHPDCGSTATQGRSSTDGNNPTHGKGPSPLGCSYSLEIFSCIPGNDFALNGQKDRETPAGVRI